jgi:hypothetical protein
MKCGLDAIGFEAFAGNAIGIGQHVNKPTKVIMALSKGFAR